MSEAAGMSSGTTDAAALTTPRNSRCSFPGRFEVMEILVRGPAQRQNPATWSNQDHYLRHHMAVQRFLTFRTTRGCKILRYRRVFLHPFSMLQKGIRSKFVHFA